MSGLYSYVFVTNHPSSYLNDSADARISASLWLSHQVGMVGVGGWGVI